MCYLYFCLLIETLISNPVRTTRFKDAEIRNIEKQNNLKFFGAMISKIV